jgi:pyruvate formate lyase activating enzyme
MSDPVEALYWQPLPDKLTECRLCPHRCRIKPGQSGRCRARKNIAGRLIAWNYGKVTSLSLDPIEKKPLNRFFPGSMILSAGSFGCNFHCDFCQNWTIAQQVAPHRLLLPGEMAEMARQMVVEGNIGLAYTYNEPLVGFEFVLDCARLIRKAGLKNVLVTNGYIESEPLTEMLPWIDAMNIDLKAWDNNFYKTICGGEADVVRRTIAQAAAVCHVEITTLLLPGLNDSEEDIRAIAGWLASIDPDITLHLNRHHPDYRMAEPAPISRQRLQRLAELAEIDLKDVLTGNN